MGKTKLNFNWRRALGVFGIFLVIGITALASAGGFDPNPNWGEVLKKVASSWLSTLIVMLLAYYDHRLSVYDVPTHPLNERHNSLAEEVKEIISRGLMFAFRQYTHDTYIKKREDYTHKLLREVGLIDPRILELSYEQIDQLRITPMGVQGDGKVVYFDTITKEQYKTLLRVKHGKFTYDELSSDYFVTSSDIRVSDVYQYHSEIKKWRSRSILMRVGIKMAIILIYSVIFAMIKKPNPDEMWVFYMTLLTHISGGVGGFLSGVKMAKEDIRSLVGEVEFKINMLLSFVSDYKSGVFVPKNLDDIVKEKLRALNGDDYEEDDEYEKHTEEDIETDERSNTIVDIDNYS